MEVKGNILTLTSEDDVNSSIKFVEKQHPELHDLVNTWLDEIKPQVVL